MANQESNDNPIFGVACARHHITYFDKREVCPESGTIVRRIVQKEDKELDRLWLKCGTCGEEVVVEVDCEGYK